MKMNFKDRKADMKLIYKNIDGLNLPMHIFLPQGDIHKAQTILFIHGGAWTDAIKDNSEWNGGWMANNARYFAENGFIGIVISYRSLLISHELNVEDILEDCEDAIKFIKNHFKFVDFANIAYVGDSAGGYITTMLGLSQNDDLRPKYSICLNPVLDSFEDKWRYGFKNCSDISKLIPKNIVGEKCAEFLFIHGQKDTVVEIESTRALQKILLDNKQKSEMIELEDAERAFGLYDFISSDEYVTKIMKRICDFID